MKRHALFAALSLAALSLIALVPRAADAEGALRFFPERGQSAAQMGQDEYACGVLARERASVHASAPRARPHRDHRSERFGEDVIGGAARGALLGVIVGAISGDAGAGAAIGASVGAVRGVFRNSARGRSYDYDYPESHHHRDRRLDAVEACMERRGYAVL